MKILTAGMCLLALLTSSAMAQNSGKRERSTTGQAGGYSYCLRTSAGPGDCKYKSFQQCQAALSGTLGSCERNTGPR